MPSQFLHLIGAGLEPRKGQPRWSCIGGITAEGARLPHASRHVPFPMEPTVLHGASPIEAGRIAEIRARQAYDATGKKRLRRDGVAILGGVVCYPIERASVNSDPLDQDIYRLWQRTTVEWLRGQFGDHLLSIVEHSDENYYHLHWYVVPTLGPNNRLNINQLHPGRYAKIVAEAEGADHKNAERSYRKGMRLWQDLFYRDVSKFFGHDRYGPRRARVTRREREMQKRIEADHTRMLADIEHTRVEMERAVRSDGWERYGRPYEQLQVRNARLEAACAAETERRLLAEAEAAALRARVTELEQHYAPTQFLA